MTHEPREPDLTPDQEQEVRRLLADARHTAPIPEDVATRLDRVLAELAEGEHPAPVVGAVVSLSSHRRRRAATMLVAAAAVVAVGVGLGQFVSSPEGSGSGAASSADSAREAPATARKDAPSSESALAGADSVDSYAVHRPVRVREQHFSADVRHARQLLRSSLRAAKDSSTESFDAAGAVPPCPRGDWGAGRLVPASYDGQQTVLVFRAVAGDTQVVDLFACGSDVALRSITLPAP